MGTGDVANGVASALVAVWSLGELGTLGNPPGGSASHIEKFDDAHSEGAPHGQAGLEDHAMESASMHDLMADLEAILPTMTEVAHDGEARNEIVIDSTVPEDDAAQLGDLGEVSARDVGDEEAVGSPAAVRGDVETGEDACGEVHGDVYEPSTLPASGVEEGAGVMAAPPIQQPEDAPTGKHR
ncbi:hypothetical protein CBR_g38803 [Chara braunii]|uniref:Uncharacterized protein n=1 Tax=Chara braunii TaxID=69332 RepID=A0A388LQH4_CHABU|nr:hypothetical protein CBR_g38803 [Chara braunii]|eukprot:GBG84521.1 hypothetical protein CBR_g38803 [Chara braunii]